VKSASGLVDGGPDAGEGRGGGDDSSVPAALQSSGGGSRGASDLDFDLSGDY
jgi:hypothetical protein